MHRMHSYVLHLSEGSLSDEEFLWYMAKRPLEFEDPGRFAIYIPDLCTFIEQHKNDRYAKGNAFDYCKLPF